MMEGSEFRKLCTEALSTKEGTQIFLDCCKKYFPKCASDMIEKVVNHNLDPSAFFTQLNDSTLDSFLDGKINKKQFNDILFASEKTKKEINPITLGEEK